ncbi:MAG: membrane dipeptidase [Chloroflexota bacterium]
MLIDALNCSNWDQSLFEEACDAGVNGAHVTLAVWENARETLSQISTWLRYFETYSDLILPVKQAADLDLAKKTGRVGIIFGFQNSSPIEDDLGLVEIYAQLGVRVMQLTYNNQTLLGSGCYEAHDGGITRFGREVINEMNRLGMVIDLSHVGEQTTLDAIEISEQPVAVTHSNPKWLSNIPRNKSDDVLSALAANDGMLGCSLYPHLIGGQEVSLKQFCAGIAHAAEIMGSERIGLGTDLVRKCTPAYLNWLRMGRWTHTIDYGAGSADSPGWPEWQAWFKTPYDFPTVAQGLRDIGFSESEVDGIMGENWYSFFKQVWK